MSQTSYSQNMDSAIVGTLVDIGMKQVVSRVNPDADMKCGLLACLGAADDLCKLPAVTGDVTGKPVGIVLREQTMESASDGSDPSIPAKRVASLLRKGTVWVKTEQDVTPSDTVFVRFSGTGDAGAFRKDADTSNAVALPGAKFMSTATAGTLV